MFSKITEADLNNKGVSGLPDTPNLSTSEMQAKFDELSKDVIVPKFNNLVEELSAQSASENIGITPPEKFTGDTIKAIIYEIVEIVLSNQLKSHEHSNKGILDGITDQNLLDLDNLVTLFSGISTVASVVSDSLSEIPNSHAIVEYVTQLGSGDMQKAIYDKDNSGVVDDAEKLGGLSAESYQKVLESSLQTENKTIPSAINELADNLSNMSIKQGDLAELQTSVKSSIVSAINEVLGSIPNMLSTLEEVDANTESGKVADALTLKQVNRNLQFPDGVGFYPDVQDGKRGYNTDAARGADTFVPFNKSVNYGTLSINALTVNIGFFACMVIKKDGTYEYVWGSNSTGNKTISGLLTVGYNYFIAYKGIKYKKTTSSDWIEVKANTQITVGNGTNMIFTWE